MDDIDGDPELRLLEKEPELWVHTVDKQVNTLLVRTGGHPAAMRARCSRWCFHLR